MSDLLAENDWLRSDNERLETGLAEFRDENERLRAVVASLLPGGTAYIDDAMARGGDR